MAESLKNPLAYTDLKDFLYAVLQVVTVATIPIVVVMIIYVGFTYVVSRGNPEKIKSANKALVYTVIGATVIIGARAILEIMSNIANSF